jgi:hypothetical protein
VDEALVGLCCVGERPRGDAGVADVDEQPLGSVEERFFGLVAGR